MEAIPPEGEDIFPGLQILGNLDKVLEGVVFPPPWSANVELGPHGSLGRGPLSGGDQLHGVPSGLGHFTLPRVPVNPCSVPLHGG